MLGKSRYQSGVSQRQYDIPGASLRGPYKRWIPQTDNRHSESETDAPKASTSSSHRTHGYSSHAAPSNTAHATLPSSSSRNPTTSSSQHAPPVTQKQRTDRNDRTLYGYSSESTVHAPVQPSKQSSSSFSLFKPHAKDSRGRASSTTKREELPRSTTAPAAVPRYQTSQPVPVPAKPSSRARDAPAPAQGGMFGSLSTETSTDPSPRSSTDSGPRNGHASAPAAGYTETRKHGHTIWNPYVDAKVYGNSHSSRNPESGSRVQTRDDKKANDKEDMVARVTEALGGGSTGKAKAVETTLLQSQAQQVKRDDASSTRRTTSSTATWNAESQPHTQSQAHPTLRRYKTTPQATPLPINAYLQENPPNGSRPSTTSSRGHPEVSPRVQGPPEPPAKVSTSSSRPPASSSSKVPHARTASSPWPFNQALPPEQPTPTPKPQTPQNHSSSWKPFSRFHGSSTQEKSTDVRSSSRDNTPSSSSHVPPPDPGRSSQTSHTPTAPPPTSSRSALPRPSAHSSSSIPSRVAQPTTAPTPQPQSQARSRFDGNPSYATTSTDQSPQRWSPSTPAPGKASATSNNNSQSQTQATQSQSVSQASRPTTSKHPETTNGIVSALSETMPAGERFTGGSAQPTPMQSPNAPATLASDRWIPAASGTQQSQSQNTSQTLWPTSSRYPEPSNVVPAPPEPLSTSAGRYAAATSAITQAVPEKSGPASAVSLQSQPASQISWSTTSRYAEPPAAAPSNPESMPVVSGRYALNGAQPATTPAAGMWTSSKYASVKPPVSNYESLERGSATPPKAGDPTATPPEPEVLGQSTANGTSTPEKPTAGAWTSKYSTANLSVATPETFPTPKPSPKVPNVEGSASATPKYASAMDAASESAGRGQRITSANVAPANTPAALTPGAWTTNARYATNTSGSIFDTAPMTKPQGTNPSPRETTRQATLGSIPVAGAWTTKSSPTSVTPPASQSPNKQTPSSDTPTPSSSLLKPQLASGTTTGTSTPSDVQLSDLIALIPPVTSHSISTRVPISGHPSTPAPVRPVLRPTPPPLSISSTSPDTDSLLTPSSLNSPRSTILLPQSHPVATITTATAQASDKETAPRKTGFFDFLRSKPLPKPLPKYEVWTPPGRNPGEKERKREDSLKDPAPPPPKSKSSAPVPVPSRPKSPKTFSPFKLFARRHRTVSSASLDVLDGTAPNTVMNSPASSMRADTPGGPPSPPIRDAILATQEWRSKEASDLQVSGRKRRHRPGVTFDCPEDIAPADIVPSRLRVARLLEEDDDY